MSASSVAKLLDYTNKGRALLNRAYNLVDAHFPPPPSLSELDKYTRALEEKWPNQPREWLAKKEGHAAFEKNARNIAPEVKGVYMFYLNLMEWSHDVWLHLRDVANNVVALRFGQTTDIMAIFLDLLGLYVRVHLLASRVTKAKLYLAVYARAYQVNTGNTEKHFLRVSTFVDKHLENPLHELRDKCSTFGLAIGDTLMALMMVVSKWEDPAMMIAKGTFTVLDDAKGMSDDMKNFTDLQELEYLDRMREWILFGFLVCPGELKRDGALHLLQSALRNGVVVSVHRDELMNVHAEYARLFETFKVDKFKLSKHKKHLKEAAKEFAGAVAQHASTRTFVRVELERLGAFFTEFPQLVPPKLHLINTLLHLGRVEILWYVRHIDEAPAAVKGMRPADFVDPHLVGLVHGARQLASLVRANAGQVSAYYAAQMSGQDSIELNDVVGAFCQSSNASSEVQDLLAGMMREASSASSDAAFDDFRRSWYSVSLNINSQQSGLMARGADRLNALMNKVVVHSRCVDRVERLVRAHASMGGLFWHRGRLRGFVDEALAGGTGQAAQVMSLVEVMCDALDNVHKLCPEEQGVIGELSVRAAEKLLGALMKVIASLVSAVMREFHGHSAQTRDSRAAEVMHAELHSRAAPAPAGFESLQGNREMVANLASWSKTLSELCTAVREADTVVVYNVEFVPREFLFEAVSELFFSSVVNGVRGQNERLYRPSEMVTNILVTYRAFHAVERHCCINLSDIVRTAMWRLFHDPAAGKVGESVENLAEAAAGAPSAVDMTRDGALMKYIINQYVNGVLKTDLKAMRVTFSPLRQGFVTYSPQQTWKAEDYMQITELTALCRVIGPAGFRSFERALLSEIVRGARKIKERLEALGPTLSSLKGNFADPKQWYDALSDSDRTRGLGKVVDVGIFIGVVLRFRALLRQAMREVSREAVPFVLQCVESLHSAKPAHAQSSVLTALEVLATDVGADTGNTDQGLRQALRPLKRTAEDARMWELLPELFAATFVTEPWKNSRYMVSTESHSSNVHCMAAAVASLIASFEVLQIDQKPVPDDIEKRTTDSLVRFARCAASSVLHMNSEERQKEFAHYSMPSIMVFIEQFVSTAGLQLSVLEEFFPYSLLRTHYIQMYEDDDRRRGAGDLADEDDAPAATA